MQKQKKQNKKKTAPCPPPPAQGLDPPLSSIYPFMEEKEVGPRVELKPPKE